MAKVIAIREIMLKPGVSEADFERFVVQECNTAWREFPTGWELSVMKGDRGDRDGRYIWVIEFESVEARNRHLPGLDQPASEEVQRVMRSQEALIKKWNEMATPLLATVYTDYVALGE